LVELANTGYEFGINVLVNIFARHKQETNFYKNFVFNLLGIFSQYLQNPLESFSIEPW
jgi:hypothetical protein